MRVIAGSARRLLLETVEGMDTRPTTDRIKETLFNMITPGLPGSNFLDLFSGSGAIGIEALSRGAKECYFVDNNKNAAGCIDRNLIHTKLKESGHLMKTEALTALRMLSDKQIVFDYIFMDPPYGLALEEDVLLYLSSSSLVNEDTIIIVESDLQTKFDYLVNSRLSIYKQKQYKNNMHTFIERRGTI